MQLKTCLAIVLMLATAVLATGQAVPPAQDFKAAAGKRPFDEKADVDAALQTALRRARKDNRRVLIEWGDNTSDWSVLLHKSFGADAGLRRKLLYEFEAVTIAISPMNKHERLAKQFQAALGDGVPYLTILDAEGKVLANQRTDPFQTKNDSGEPKIDAKKLLEFLTKFQAKPLVAAKVLQDGLDQAAKSDRLVFLHFGAPWCGWCHRLEDWMALPDVSATLGKEFVDVSIDIDRMDGGKELLARYNASAKGGIPWFAFLDAKGKALATSDGAKGNIGFPYEEHEVAHFVKMLDTAKRRLSQSDIERIGESLKTKKKAGKS